MYIVIHAYVYIDLSFSFFIYKTFINKKPDFINTCLSCSPGYTKVVKGEGVPVSNNTTERGDLIIEFNIVFPKQLSPEQKELLTKALND